MLKRISGCIMTKLERLGFGPTSKPMKINPCNSIAGAKLALVCLTFGFNVCAAAQSLKAVEGTLDVRLGDLAEHGLDPLRFSKTDTWLTVINRLQNAIRVTYTGEPCKWFLSSELLAEPVSPRLAVKRTVPGIIGDKLAVKEVTTDIGVGNVRLTVREYLELLTRAFGLVTIFRDEGIFLDVQTKGER